MNWIETTRSKSAHNKLKIPPIMSPSAGVRTWSAGSTAVGATAKGAAGGANGDGEDRIVDHGTGAGEAAAARAFYCAGARSPDSGVGGR